MTNKIIQWSIRGAKTNINELSSPRLLTRLSSYVYRKLIERKGCSQHKTLLNLQFHQTSLRRLINTHNNSIHHSEIIVNTNLQVVAIIATFHKTITFCSIYILPDEIPNETELHKLIQQLPKPFILMGNFNSHT